MSIDTLNRGRFEYCSASFFPNDDGHGEDRFTAWLKIVTIVLTALGPDPYRENFNDRHLIHLIDREVADPLTFITFLTTLPESLQMTAASCIAKDIAGAFIRHSNEDYVRVLGGITLNGITTSPTKETAQLATILHRFVPDAAETLIRCRTCNRFVFLSKSAGGQCGGCHIAHCSFEEHLQLISQNSPDNADDLQDDLSIIHDDSLGSNHEEDMLVDTDDDSAVAEQFIIESDWITMNSNNIRAAIPPADNLPPASVIKTKSIAAQGYVCPSNFALFLIPYPDNMNQFLYLEQGNIRQLEDSTMRSIVEGVRGNSTAQGDHGRLADSGDCEAEPIILEKVADDDDDYDGHLATGWDVTSNDGAVVVRHKVKVRPFPAWLMTIVPHLMSAEYTKAISVYNDLPPNVQTSRRSPTKEESDAFFKHLATFDANDHKGYTARCKTLLPQAVLDEAKKVSDHRLRSTILRKVAHNMRVAVHVLLSRTIDDDTLLTVDDLLTVDGELIEPTTFATVSMTFTPIMGMKTQRSRLVPDSPSPLTYVQPPNSMLCCLVFCCR